MTAAPCVTVVIPVYNGAAYLLDSLDGVLAQTMGDFEVVVVDDGSTDATSEIAARYAQRDRRVNAVRLNHVGLPGARNAGVGFARGKFVAFLDADDVWLPEKLERQVDHLERNQRCEACFTYFEEIDNDHRVVTSWGELAERYDFPNVTSDVLVAQGNRVAGSGSSIMARIDAVREAGGFDERLIAAEDLDLWYRLALRAPLEVVTEVLVRIRRRPDQFQADVSRVMVGRVQFLENVRQHGALRHRRPAYALERRIRAQLVRRFLREGQLLRSSSYAASLAFGAVRLAVTRG